MSAFVVPQQTRAQFRRAGRWRAAALLSGISLGVAVCVGTEPEPPELQPLDQALLAELEPAARRQVLEAHREAQEHPQDATPVGKLGMILQAYGKFDAAETCYRRAQALAPANFRWTYLLGNAEAWLGKYPQAIAHLQAAIELDPDYAPAKVRLAQLLFDTGEVDQSRRLCEAVLRRNPRLASAHLALGKALAASGDWPGAIAA